MKPAGTHPLAGKVAVVAGATRGAGRGIAQMLGAAGATVYGTGRSSRHAARTHTHHYAQRPETIEETAELVTAAGGTGIAVRVDHTDEAQVEALFERVATEQGRLDVLVNVITGPQVIDWSTPFWKLPVEAGRALFDAWVWPHVLTARHAMPLLVRQQGALAVELIEQEGLAYHGTYYFDLFEVALKRLAFALAQELRPHGGTAVALTPGFMRTEAILDHFDTTSDRWRETAETHPEAKQWGFIHSETPCFVGRAVAALAADPEAQRWSGGIYSSWRLSQAYGFTDLDGTQPNIWPAVAEKHAEMFGTDHAPVQWTQVGRPGEEA